MEELRSELDALLDRLDDPVAFRDTLENLESVYPFNEFEYIDFSPVVHRYKLSIDEYYEIRDNDIHRNLYPYLFEISAPRGYGERWAHGHLKELVPSLQRPSKQLESQLFRAI